MKLQWFIPMVMAGITAVASATITIPTTSAGDGFFHDELGTSSDYFDSAGTTVSAYYTFWGTSDTVQYNTGYLQFSLASVAPGASIASATLNLYLSERHYSADSPSAGFVRHVADSSSANGNASQRLGGGDQIVEIKDQPVGWLTLDVTSFLQSDINGSYPYACFSLNPNTAGYFRDAGFTIHSSENALYQPYLSITLVPEPSYAWLLCPATLLLLRRRR